MDEKTDYMTHCDSGPEFQDTPHGSVRCFHLRGAGGVQGHLTDSLAQSRARQ